MKIKVQFTVDVIPENIQAYLDELEYDETVREYVQSFFASLDLLLDEHIEATVGLPALVNNN
jgi:hypothetical protein